MNPAELRLVTAVKAGDEVDFSACPERERTLRAGVLREILLSRVEDDPGLRRIRLRGAVIEGDLDLRDVPATVTVDLDAKRPGRLRALFRLPDGMGIGQYITALAFGFVVIKLIWIARGDIPTALGVFNSAGLATVIVGGLLSALPVISATALGWAAFEISRRSRPLKRKFPSDRFYWAGLSAAAVACFFLAPWPVMVSGAVLGLVSGAVAARAASKTAKPAAGERKRVRRIGRLGAWAVVGIFSFYLVLNPLLYAVWLPHENLKLTKPNPQPMVGYVLSDSNGWVSVLRTGVRRIYRFPAQNVLARDLCKARSISIPAMPAWFNSPSSLWNIILPGESQALHICP